MSFCENGPECADRELWHAPSAPEATAGQRNATSGRSRADHRAESHPGADSPRNGSTWRTRPGAVRGRSRKAAAAGWAAMASRRRAGPGEGRPSILEVTAHPGGGIVDPGGPQRAVGQLFHLLGGRHTPGCGSRQGVISVDEVIKGSVSEKSLTIDVQRCTRLNVGDTGILLATFLQATHLDSKSAIDLRRSLGPRRDPS
jgi:hypothetical protein